MLSKLTRVDNLLGGFICFFFVQPHCFHFIWKNYLLIGGWKRICLRLCVFFFLLWKHFIRNGSWVMSTPATPIKYVFPMITILFPPVTQLCDICLFHVTTVCTPTVLQWLHFPSCNLSDRDDTSALNAHLQTPSSLRATQVFFALLGPGRLNNTALARPCYLDCHSNSFSPCGPISQTLCQ